MLKQCIQQAMQFDLERAERAFQKFKNSCYKDKTAFEDWLKWRESWQIRNVALKGVQHDHQA